MALRCNKAGRVHDRARREHDRVMRMTGLSAHDSGMCATKVFYRDKDFFVATNLTITKIKIKRKIKRTLGIGAS